MRHLYLPVFLLSAGLAPAQNLLHDIDSRGVDMTVGSKPASFVTVGKAVYFHAEDPIHGREIWRSDGSAQGTTLLRDLMPGPADGVHEYSRLHGVAGRLVFTGQGVEGPGIWASDGTPGGTERLAAVIVRGDQPGQMVSEAGRLWFIGRTQGHGAEIWVSDGTAAGTRRVTDIQAGAASSLPNTVPTVAMVAVFGRLFFAADDGVHGLEPWVTDGTPAGTFMLADLNLGANGSNPFAFAAYGVRAMFVADPYGNGQRRYFVSDGTKAGTSSIGGPQAMSYNPGDFVQLGKEFLFLGLGAEGVELWRTDGSAAGTSLVKDIRPGPTASGIQELTVLGGKAYFSANDGQAGRELWVTDGSSQGTQMVRDLTPGSRSTSMGGLRATATRLVFAANADAATGYELYQSDGTAAGTTLLKDLQPGTGHGYPRRIEVTGPAEVWFMADNGGGEEPFRSDLSAQGTGRVADLARQTHGSRPGQWRSTGHRALFMAQDGGAAHLPWVTDGSLRGTRTLQPWGLSRRGIAAPGVCQVGNTVYLSMADQLWRSDLWFENPQILDAVPGAGSELVTAGGSLYFGAGTRLYVSDGKIGGARMVRDFGVSVFYPAGPHRWQVVDGRPYFLASEGQMSPSGLWTTDGTAAGTRLLVPARVGLLSNSEVVIATLGTTLVMGVDIGPFIELWAVQGGTAARIFRAPDDAARRTPLQLAPVGKHLLLSAGDASTGTELWVCDGTAAGTRQLVDLVPGPVGSAPAEFCPLGDTCMFVAHTAAAGRELWISDGTAGGTRMVKDLLPGPAGSGIEDLFHIGGGKVVFSAHLPALGRELWVSDGTAAGTRLALDYVPGPASSDPQAFARLGGTLLFSAEDGIRGQEPRVLSLAALGAPVADVLGTGCPGQHGRVPQLTADGMPRVAAASFALRLRDARPQAGFAVWLAAAPARLQLGSCMMHTDAPLLTLVGQTNNLGEGYLPIPMPNNPQLLGLEAVAQALVVDSQGAYQGLFAFSGGLWLVVGD